MKKSSIFILLFTVWGIAGALTAQPGTSLFPPIEKLTELLELDDDQVSAVTELAVASREQLKELRDQTFEQRENRIAAFRDILESNRVALANLLTSEQLEKLEAYRSGRISDLQDRQPRLSDEDRKALHTAVSAYREDNILPILLEQRTALEAEITAEDQVTIARLREQRSAFEPRWRQRNQPFCSEKDRATMKAFRDSLYRMVEKYETPIDNLLYELKPQAEKWRNDLRAIAVEYLPEGNKPNGHGKHRHEKGDLHKGRFLLLDPNTGSAAPEIPAQKDAIQNVRVFPNPAVSTATISYAIVADGQVRIELFDESGKLRRVVFDGYLTNGHYLETVNISNLGNGTYYFSIRENGSIRTQQLIITE